jgi:hypothetical protein
LNKDEASKFAEISRQIAEMRAQVQASLAESNKFLEAYHGQQARDSVRKRLSDFF